MKRQAARGLRGYFSWLKASARLKGLLRPFKGPLKAPGKPWKGLSPRQASPTMEGLPRAVQASEGKPKERL
jgi:hypothetical protein